MTAASRSGFVALLGAPNAGKSTLLNRVVGSKVSIVTHKVQTTRSRIRGVVLRDDCQIVFVDTPGIFEAKRRLERSMVSAAWAGAQDADAIVLLFDAQRSRVDSDTRLIMKGLKDRGLTALLALNKIDQIPRPRLLELAGLFAAEGLFTATYMISALTGDGLDTLMADLAGAMPEGPWLYPEDQLSDLPLRLMAAEVTREKLFLSLHQELPYSLAVETEAWEDFKNGDIRIEQTIYVARESQKGICLGKGGRTIKAVRAQVQEELSAQFGHPVHLFLFVKVRERWVDDPERYRTWGLDYDV